MSRGQLRASQRARGSAPGRAGSRGGSAGTELTPRGSRGALDGLRVVELGSSVSAAYCGRQLALWGADVVTLEPAGGSPLRCLAPHVPTARDSGEAVSLLWQYVASGKRALDLDAATPDRDSLLELLAATDLLVVDRDDAPLLARGLSLDRLHEDLPHLVIVSVTPFGLEGPFAQLEASELTIQALSGYAHFNGDPDKAPLKAPGHMLAYTSGVAACVGGLAALIGQEETGYGRIVDVSEADSLSAMLPLLRCEYTGVHPQRLGGPNTGVRAFPCRDGFVTFVPPELEQIENYGAVLDVAIDDWPTAEGLEPPERRLHLVPFLIERTATKKVDEIFYGLLDRGIVCGRIATPSDLVEDSHLRERGFFHPIGAESLDDEGLGSIRMPGPAAQMSETPADVFGPAPETTEQFHSRELGWARRRQPASGARPTAGPLAGVRVLDATQAWVGPFATMLLADLGADMIKIESHLRPDVWRRSSVNPVAVTNVRADQVNASPNYNSANRNKRSLCLNLKTDEAKEIFRRLAAESDLVMENFTPRVMDRFGLGYAELSQINPRLVMTSFSGYGKTGPLAEYKANGTSIEAMAGWDHLHRYEGEPPMVMGFYQADAITGYQMAAATLVALLHQRRTGRGQAVEGSMYEAAVGYIGETLLEAQLGPLTAALGNRSSDMVPSGIYRCAGEDRWIAISAPTDATWQKLKPLMGDARLAGKHLCALAGRRQHEDEIDEILAAWTSRREASELMAELQQAGVPAGTVRSTEEIFDCEHLAARRWFRTIEHADMGAHRYNGAPMRLVGHERPPDLPPPRLGEHGRVLLRERLGYGEAEIDALFSRGVTGFVAADREKRDAPAR